MAWDCPRRYDPLPRALEQPNLSVDELVLHKIALEFSSCNTQDAHQDNMHAQLSPIEEERRFPACTAPLQVHVTAKFHDPAIRFTYKRTYYSSESFIPTERICRGLVRRIEHCSEEFITRKDSDALNATQCLHKGPKHLRFELIFEIARAGHSGVWAETSFKSYQKHALTTASAKEALQSTHRILGLFLKRHDKGFEWTDEPAYDHFPDKPETFRPSPNGILNLACVPRSLFIESHQAWEFIPGYSFELTFNSSNPARRQSEIRRILTVDSGQNAPLNLGLGEDLLWQAYRSVQDVLDQQKSSFDSEHANCDGFDGVPDCDCQHFDENALDVGLRIINNLGPVHDHLHRSIQSRLRLFTHPNGQDCDEFVYKIQARLNHFRDGTDKKMDMLKDFDFRIAEMTGHGWHEKNCARFILDGKHSHTRRSVEALLDRIRTGVSEILRGNDVAIRMIAYKRGHLILDKALIARDHQSTPRLGSSPEDQQRTLLARLKTRIQRDIDMICKDTCSIDDILDTNSIPERDLCQPLPAFSPSRPLTPRGTSQRQDLDGPPGNFATRPQTPPEISERRSSRVFALVPARFQENKWPGREFLSVRHSVVGVKCNDDDLGGFPKSATGVAIPHAAHEQDRQGITRANDHESLKSAAEVYPASKEEHETDSSSTHSSMPALTESDSPSPGQSMLITPSCLRSSSPISHGPPSIEDLRSLHFSNPFVIDNSAPNSTTFSDVDRFEDSRAALPTKAALTSSRPETPNHTHAEKSVPVSTPKALGDTSGAGKAPVPHRCMQGFVDTDDPGCAGDGLISKNTGTESDCSNPVPQHLPTEGWLFHCAGEDSFNATPPKNDEDDVTLALIAECDSSETLRPSIVIQQRSMDGVAALGDAGPIKTGSLMPKSVFEQRSPKFNEEAKIIQPSVPKVQFALDLRPDSDEDLKIMTLGDDLSRTKLDFFEQDEDSAFDSETTSSQYAVEDNSSTQAESRLMGLSERSVATGHVIPLSDSGIDVTAGSEATDRSWSEFGKKHILSPIDESTLEFDGYNGGSTSQGLEMSLTEPKRENASGPFDSEHVRRGDEMLPVSSKGSSTNTDEGPENPSEESKSVKTSPTSAPTLVSDPVKLPKVRSSTPMYTVRAASNPQPSQNLLGLDGAHLLPALPVFTNLRSVSHDTRASCSTSSSWEDYVSAGRHSSDSVDTIKASPRSSEQNDHPDSPKRLGTPTAGLLGLNESRWAEFGLRTALTGTQALERPATAPMTEMLESRRHDAKASAGPDHGDDKMAKDKPSSPRKSVHLRSKKSIGSMIVASKLKRKESKEVRKQKSVDLKTLKDVKPKSKESTAPRLEDDGAARFPRAMMLVAGLAFASSVVSRNHT